jgi:uncharacterized delta-60 repeat protein
MKRVPQILKSCHSACVLSTLASLSLAGPACGQAPDGFNPGASNSIYALAIQSDGKVLVGGAFTTLAGQPCSHIGRLNPDGTLDTAFNPGAGSNVNALAIQADGKILVGGSFTTLGGQTRTNLGRLNSDGTLDDTFNASASSNVYALALQADGGILVAGAFTRLGGQAHTNLARLDAAGGLDAGFVAAASGPVYCLAQQADGKILVGGFFTNLCGQVRTNLGRLETNGTLDAGFTAHARGPSAFINALAVQANGQILVGGAFANLGGQARTNLGRLNSDGGPDAGFITGVSGGGFPLVYSLGVQANGQVLVGGAFTNLGGQMRTNIGRLNSDGGLDTGFHPGANSYVLSLALQPDGKILAAGSFTSLGGQPRVRIGRLQNTEPATQSLAFENSTLTWQRGGTSPEIWRASFDFTTNGTDWVVLGNGTRLPGGWQLTNVVAPANCTLRARGFVAGGQFNGSSWFVERTLPTIPLTVLVNDGDFGFRDRRFGFNFTTGAGSAVVLEVSTNLVDWTALATNRLGPSPLYFSDPGPAGFPWGFYRARLW